MKKRILSIALALLMLLSLLPSSALAEAELAPDESVILSESEGSPEDTETPDPAVILSDSEGSPEDTETPDPAVILSGSEGSPEDTTTPDPAVILSDSEGSPGDDATDPAEDPAPGVSEDVPADADDAVLPDESEDHPAVLPSDSEGSHEDTQEESAADAAEKDAKPLDAAQDVVASGECGAQGSNLTWTLDNNGVFTISGVGEMKNYSADLYSGCDSPWTLIRDNIHTVVIDDEVTSIGDYAFYFCDSITTVTIPDSVTSIGKAAFLGCNKLASVDLPKSLVYLRENTFRQCDSLTSVIIPDGVTHIEALAFGHCSGLIDISIPQSVRFIGDSALYNCNSLSSISIPSGVTYIGDSCFAGCSSLTSVTFVGDMPTLFEYSFNQVTATIYYPWNNPTYTAENMVDYGGTLFWEPTGYTPTVVDSGTCGDNLSWTLDEDGRLTISGTGEMWDDAFSNDTRIIKLIIENGVSSIGGGAFEKCSNLSSVVIPESVTLIGSRAFSECDKIVTAGPIRGKYNIRFEWTNEIPMNAFNGCSSLTNVIIPESVVCIGGRAFSNCSGLTSITIPSSVTSIGDEIFENCTNLKEIHFEGAAPSIGDGAFSNISASVYYPAYDISWTATIGQNFGGRITWVPVEPQIIASGECGKNGTNTRWKLYENGILWVFGEGEMRDYPSEDYTPWASYRNRITEISIGDGVTTVSVHAFGECSKLIHVSISDSVTRIGSYAFADCVSLVEISIPNGITDIYCGTFRGCTSISNLKLPDCLTRIETQAFYECTGLTSIIIPENVGGIPDTAFYGCSNLKSITLLGNMPSISSDAFVGVTATVEYPANNDTYTIDLMQNYGGVLTWVPVGPQIVASGTCGDNLTWTLDDTGTLTISGTGKMWDYSYSNRPPWFENRSLIQAVTICSGVANLGDDAFSECNALINVTIPESVTSIGGWAFNNCSGLTSVFIPEYVTNIGAYAFSGCKSLTRVNIPSGVKNISSSVFSSCSNLTEILVADDNSIYCSVNGVVFSNDKTKLLILPCGWEGSYVIPDGTTSISFDAVYGCEKIVSITVPSTITSIPNGSFSNCKSLTEIIVMADNVTYCDVEGVVFNKDCTELLFFPTGRFGTYIVPDGVTSIGSNAFSTCSGVTDVQLPSSVTSIGSSAFAYCSNLSDFQLPYGVESIGNRAFSSCYKLTSITIPESVTSIGSYAFGWCGLKNIVFEGSAPSIGEGAFYNVTATVHYSSDGTWTEYNKQDYNGSLTWIADRFTVSYDANGGKNPPGPQTKTLGIELILTNDTPIRDVTIGSYTVTLNPNGSSAAAETVSATWTDSYSFANWNTEADGSGKSYASGGSYTEDADATLYAQWNDTRITEAIVLPGASREGYYFLGWAEEENATTAEYHEGEEYTPCNDVTLFAVWQAKVYPVSYSGNGGTGVPVEQAKIHDEPLVLSEEIPTRSSDLVNTYTILFNPNGGSADEESLTSNQMISYSFDSWNTEADGNGISYAPGESYTENEELTLYAQWDSRETTEAVVLPAATRDGYVLSGWVLDGPGESREYQPGESFVPGDNASFSAVWKLNDVGLVFGQCGDHLFWHVDPTTRTLTITGVGDMWEYANSNSYGLPTRPWEEHIGKIIKIVVEEGVTSVNAFQNCNRLTTVYLPSSLRSIGNYTFAGCSALGSMAVPSNVMSIGRNAFSDCSGLSSISLPDHIDELGEYAFYECVRLTSIAIPNGVPSIAECTFWGCNALTSVIIPQSVKTISEYAFAFCEGITSISLPEKLESIRRSAFYYCYKLQSVSFPATISNIASDAFGRCSDIQRIIFTGNVPTIASDAFYDVTADAFYPADADWWPEDLLNYGGKLTWHSYTGKPPVFTDVSDPGAYYYDAVYWALENGITTGLSPTSFGPNASCTREQTVTFLWRMMGCPTPATRANFRDVKAGSWYEEAVSWASEKGVTTGLNATTFGVGKTCTREQFVTFLWRAADCPAPTERASFRDVKAGSWYEDAVSWAYENGITTGLNATTFGVGGTCSRGQVVTFLYRFSKLAG